MSPLKQTTYAQNTNASTIEAAIALVLLLKKVVS